MERHVRIEAKQWPSSTFLYLANYNSYIFSYYKASLGANQLKTGDVSSNTAAYLLKVSRTDITLLTEIITEDGWLTKIQDYFYKKEQKTKSKECEHIEKIFLHVPTIAVWGMQN